MNSELKTNITDYQRQVLEMVKDGHDVYGHGVANACRIMERAGLVCIGPAIDPPDGDGGPFFGCIATQRGLEALRS